MTRRWTLCSEKTPSDARQVVVALPDRTDTVAGEYVASTGQWFHANTNDEIWPIMWRDMHEHPFASDQ